MTAMALVIQQTPASIARDIVVTDPPEVRDAVWTFRGRTLLDGWDPEGHVVQLSGPVG